MVLEAAFFPVRELLERCRRSLAILAAWPTGTGKRVAQDAQGQGSVPAAVDAVGGKNGGSHWAKEGLHEVCCYLETALAGNFQRDLDSCKGHGKTSSAADQRSPAFDPGLEQTHAGARACDPLCDSNVDAAVAVAGLRRVDVGMRVHTGAPDQDREGGATGSDLNDAKSPEEVAGGRNRASPPIMMDLESLEIMLDGEGRVGSCSDVVRASSTDGAVEAGSFGVDNAAIRVAAEGAVGVGERRAGAAADSVGMVHGFGQFSSNVGVIDCAGQGGDTGDVWELVEGWTPCAIGTLPGWSGAALGGRC